MCSSDLALRTEGDRAVLAVAGRTISFPEWVGPALRTSLAGPTTAAQLAAGGDGIDEPDAVVLLRRLVRELVVVPAGPPS